MPCLILVLGLMIPRILAVALYIAGWFEGVFDTMLWPVLGFIFMPTTLLWYGYVHRYLGGQWGVLAILGLIVAILIDLGPAAGKRRAPATR